MHSGRVRVNRHKLKQEGFRLDVGRNFFSTRMVKQWLPREAVRSPSLEVFKTHLDKARSDLTPDPALSRRLEWRFSEVPSSLNYSMIIGSFSYAKISLRLGLHKVLAGQMIRAQGSGSAELGVGQDGTMDRAPLESPEMSALHQPSLSKGTEEISHSSPRLLCRSLSTSAHGAAVAHGLATELSINEERSLETKDIPGQDCFLN
ncbi:hypothetical protein QYF61_014565 [Mycteria americana]|uniref:Uncharacterized protein n=1 Tax=Mycteria americana TaxID=33587 RepID=A0AAN7NV32_MYCAM|nr:hypothetical protein QYF61_014565 [Mycteria americana]